MRVLALGLLLVAGCSGGAGQSGALEASAGAAGDRQRASLGGGGSGGEAPVLAAGQAGDAPSSSGAAGALPVAAGGGPVAGAGGASAGAPQAGSGGSSGVGGAGGSVAAGGLGSCSAPNIPPDAQWQNYVVEPGDCLDGLGLYVAPTAYGLCAELVPDGECKCGSLLAIRVDPASPAQTFAILSTGKELTRTYAHTGRYDVHCQGHSIGFTVTD